MSKTSDTLKKEVASEPQSTTNKVENIKTYDYLSPSGFSQLAPRIERYMAMPFVGDE